MPTINSEVAIGCRMNGSEMPPAHDQGAFARRDWRHHRQTMSWIRRARLDQGTLLQSVIGPQLTTFSAGRQTLHDD